MNNGVRGAPDPLAPLLGRVIGGSLREGVQVKLNPGVSVEEMAVGTYVTIEGERRRFFCLVTDIRLGALDPRGLVSPPDLDDPLIAEVWASSAIYGVLEVLPLLTIDRNGILGVDGPQPVKAIPAHYATARRATEEDVQTVFGEDDASHFVIGTPVDMETKVCLDLARLVERSVGVFGKSGTGKTFLTRLLLAGIVQKSSAVSLVFDMHNEYGWEGTAEGGRGKVRALKQLYGPKVAVYTLDAESSRRRQVRFDYEVTIGLDQIEPEDIVLLSDTLSLSGPMVDGLYAVRRRFGRQWLAHLLDADDEESRQQLADEVGAHLQALGGLQRRLRRLADFSFLVRERTGDWFHLLLDALERGTHVVLEFGRFNNLTAYVLVANLLTRRIHDHYVRKKEEALGDKSREPKPLVIAIEEAHKFLSPGIADQTIFGTIARELRKYNVTLLVIDQRPSGIDDEVLSQVGTRICCLLDNERDVDAVLAGTAGRSELRSVLSRLETRQQALVFGHAVPMPVVIRTREYGTEDSYRELGFREAAALSREERVRERKSDFESLFGED